MTRFRITRRRFLTASAAGVAGTALGACEPVEAMLRPRHPVREALASANGLTQAVQRALMGRDALAREFSESEIRQGMRPNGATDPMTPEYIALRAGDFQAFTLEVTGLVETPRRYSLAELRAMPARTQITRHDCVEGWSAIGKWTGVPLSLVLDEAGVRPGARYVVFRCFDTMGAGLTPGRPYYESIDLIDAYHPQTILAYGLNDAALPVPNGAPLRVRVERQLGYKMAKYVYRIELVESFAAIGGGRGSYWADFGYDWYAGI